jgi:hypothetical protein
MAKADRKPEPELAGEIVGPGDVPSGKSLALIKEEQAQVMREFRARTMPQVADTSTFVVTTLPMEAVQELADENLGGQELGQFDLPRVKIPAGESVAFQVFTVGRPRSQDEFSGIIIHKQAQRVFWKKAYSGSGGQPPDCSSVDAVFGQGDPGGPCKTCPMSKYGTARGKNGEELRGQACKEVLVLYILTPGSLLPYVLILPPTSLGNSKQYFTDLMSMGQLYYGVLTKFSLKTEKNQDGTSYAQAVLLPDGRLADEVIPKIKAIRDSVRPPVEVLAETAEVGGEAAGRPYAA